MKRITGLQVGESAEGSRVILTSDSLLDDYEAFRRGDRFYVRIPSADFVAAAPRFKGNGFEDVQVQKVGDSVVISFRLHPGASARVIGAASRLEVIFTSPNHFARNTNANAVRNRVVRNSAGEKNPSTRSFPRTGSQVAGPMPPDSPNTGTDLQNAAPTTASRSRTSGHASRTSTVSTNVAVPAGTPIAVTMATPDPTTSPYSATYPPATSTYTPIQIQPVAQTNDKFFGLESRSRAFLQWVRINKTASLGAGIAVMGLIGVVLFLLYRGRRNRLAAMAKSARVQPKYSSDVELEDILTTRLATESSKVQPRRYVEPGAYERWSEDTGTDNAFFEDLTTDSQADVAYPEAVAPAPYDAQREESWEFVPESSPQVYKSRVQEEREVFEL